MADKLKKGLAVQTSFVSGETPSAVKLDSIAAQAAYALAALESAVGDAHDESFPYSIDNPNTKLSLPARKQLTDATVTNGDANGRPLDIVNLARLVGPASNLNPHELESGSVVQSIPTGVHEFHVKYPIDGAIPAAITIAGDTSSVFVTHRATLSDLDATGDWHADSDGRVFTVDATVDAGATIEYNVDPTKWGGGTGTQGGRFNVIPDPNQIEAGGSALSVGALGASVAGFHRITLPTATHQQWSLSQDNALLTDADINNGLTLKLPAILDGYSAGHVIPSGFVLLKNYTTGVVYTGASYVYNTSSIIDVGNIDLTTEIAAANKFCLITVGNSITSAVDDLRRKANHSHDRSWGEPLIDVASLAGAAAVEGDSGAWTKSEIPGNFAPQYLHRDGSTKSTITDRNINDDNAIRGDLVVGRSGGVAGDYSYGVGSSFKLYFGNYLDSGSDDTYIWRNASNEIELLSENADVVLSTTGTGDVRLDPATNRAVTLDASGTGAVQLSTNGIISSAVTSIAVLPYVVLLDDAANDFNGSGVLDINLSTELNSKTIHSFQMLLTTSGGSTWNAPGDGGSGNGYTAWIDDSANPRVLKIRGQSTWFSVLNVEIRFMAWYS